MKKLSQLKQWILSICFHDWVMDKKTVVECNRKCRKCGKWQHSVYDMAYGSTYWVDGKHWEDEKKGI